MSEPQTTAPQPRLRKIGRGTWLPLGAVRSVVAFGATDIMPGLKPRVIIKTDHDTLEWPFDTYEAAEAYADKIAEMCNAKTNP